MPGPLRLLVTVAHPDDETFGCGSLLAAAASRGVETAVCCATRGEAGEPAPGSGIDPADLGSVREGELRAAAAVLGVRHVDLLDHRDSGMEGPPAPGTLTALPLAALADELTAVIDHRRPHVVVTLDGADGHRDHVHVRDATLAAVAASRWPVERTYLHGIPRSLLRRWADHTRSRDPDSPYLDVDAAGLGTPDATITTVVDVAAYLKTRWAAIACHASQTSPFAGLPDELARDFLTVDHLVRVAPPADGRREVDIFAGVGQRDADGAAPAAT